jgi:ABC-type dipeptide/oligopeptide/nickel transport system permease subunit
LASFFAVGLTMWVEVARVVRGQVISVKEMQYVTAARALVLGTSGSFSIIFYPYYGANNCDIGSKFCFCDF